MKRIFTVFFYSHRFITCELFCKRGNELDQQVSKYGSMNTQSSKTIWGKKRDLEVCNSAPHFSVMSSTTHFSIHNKGCEKFCSKAKTLPLCSIQIYPNYSVKKIGFVFSFQSIYKHPMELHPSGTGS